MQTRQQAIFGIGSVAFLWGLPALFIHYFGLHFDAHTQNFWRYLVALAFLVVYGFWTRRLRLNGIPGALGRISLAALALVCYQVCFTTSLYVGRPALVGLLIQLELIVALGLSCVFFADERRTVASPWFVMGAAATMAGAAGMVVFSPQFSAGPGSGGEWHNLWGAVALVAGAAAFWGCYSVAIKWSLEVVSPFSAFIAVEVIATAAFLILGLCFGRLDGIFEAPGFVLALVFFSAIGCIGLAQVLYTAAIQRLGVVVCNTVILGSPVVTAFFSRIFFKEHLTVLQIVSAAVLLFGAGAAVQSRRRAARRRIESALEKNWTASLPHD